MPDLTPEQWIASLWTKLDERTRRIQLFDDYYLGNQQLRFTTSKARETFGRDFGGFADNFCLLVVDAVEERLRVRGFRVGGGSELDQNAAQIWKRNDMAIGSSMAHIEALVNEQSYAIVWLDPDDRTKAQITVESPFEVIIECDRAYRGKRVAALKRWLDADKLWHAVLYLPDAIYKYVAAAPVRGSASIANAVKRADFWNRWEIESEEWPLPNPLGVVPVVPFTNMPRLAPDQGGTSEIAAVVPLQDWLNKGAFDELIASEFVAFPQRVLVNVDIPTDENGQPIEAFKAGVNRIWFVKQAEGVSLAPQIEQFPQANLSPYADIINLIVDHIGAITKTPRHYLLNPGGGTNFSGETLKALEAGLVSKVRRRMAHFGNSWEEVMAIAMRLEEGGRYQPIEDDRIEVDWADPETRTEAQHVDAVVKIGSAPINVPQEQLWKELGYTDEEIRRFKEMTSATPAEPAAPEQLIAGESKSPIAASGNNMQSPVNNGLQNAGGSA